MHRAQRFKAGSVVFDKRRKTWNLLEWKDGKRTTRRIGNLKDYPTKGAAQRAVLSLPLIEDHPKRNSPAIGTLVEQYRAEKMPQRKMTRQGYNTWLTHYIIPMWGSHELLELQARPVELWLDSLKLAPKSKVHIRGLISILWEFAMWRGDVPVQRNPMELVTIKGATKRKRQPRSLTVEEFQKIHLKLSEPMRTIALVCVCFGLRISEALALKWSDVNWLESTLRVERGIVHQVVDDVKTPESQQLMYIDAAILEALKVWNQATEFSKSDDWMFASTVSIGRLPFSYSGVWQSLRKAAKKAEIGHVSSHVFRHTYRTWLDSFGTPVGVQQKLMRHSDIRTTMNIYGTGATAEMKGAHSKVVGLAVNGLQTDCNAA